MSSQANNTIPVVTAVHTDMTRHSKWTYVVEIVEAPNAEYDVTVRFFDAKGKRCGWECTGVVAAAGKTAHVEARIGNKNVYLTIPGYTVVESAE